MPKYHVHGTIGDKKVDQMLEANIGTEALAAVVEKYMPKAVREGKKSRLYWWHDNVRVECDPVDDPAPDDDDKTTAA